MAKFVCLLLFLAVLANTGLSLKCYNCHSEKSDGCLKSSSPGEKKCGNPAPGQKQVCYYKETQGYALHCYTCKSNSLSTCTKGSSEMKETLCGLEHPPVLRFCIFKIVYDKVEKIETVEAGCEEVRKDVGRVGKELVAAPIMRLDKNVEQCQPNERYDVTYCKPCDKDLCNFTSSSSISQMSIRRFSGLLFLYIFAKFVFR